MTVRKNRNRHWLGRKSHILSPTSPSTTAPPGEHTSSASEAAAATATAPLRRNPDTCKGAIDTSAWPEEPSTIPHLLLQHRLRLQRQNCYLPLLRLQTKTTGTQRNTDPLRRTMELPCSRSSRRRFYSAFLRRFRLSLIRLVPVVVFVLYPKPWRN